MITLGSKVKEIITGFEGIVTGRAQYLTGCDQYLINPYIKEDGTLSDSQWFDEQRLRVDTARPPIIIDNTNGNGADKAAPRR